MKTKLLIAALLFSVGFNLFFLTGYFRARYILTQPQTLQQRIQAAGKKLGFNKAQQIELMNIFHITQQRQKEWKKHQRRLTHKFLTEFHKSNPDIRRLKSQLGILEKERRQLRRFARRSWKQFMSSLTPAQHDAVTRLLKRRPDLYRKLLLVTPAGK